MTEHSRHLVETIARALYRHRMATVDTIDGWTDWGDLPESWRCEWRDAAEAALDAMPQPDGYGTNVTYTMNGSGTVCPTCNFGHRL